MNKSSSFYSESYYQRARKQANTRKPIYREKNKELFDQEHELQFKYFFINRTGTCQMIYFHNFVIQAFNDLVQKDKRNEIKGSDDFNSAYGEFQSKVREKMKFFNDNIMSNQFETRDEIAKRQQQTYFYSQSHQRGLIEFKNMIHHKHLQPNMQICQRRLTTCNQCAIFIEEFQTNFQKVIKEMNKTSVHWNKLNGHQKFAKLRTKFQQLFRVLKYELETKCTYATEQAMELANQTLMYNHIKR